MRRPVQAGYLLASALAQPAIAQETIPAALVALRLPATAENADAPPLAFLRLDVRETAAACSDVPSLSVNGVPLAADDHHVLTYHSGLGELVLGWEADCVSWGGAEREQQLRLRVASVDGVAASTDRDGDDAAALVVRFRQTHPVRIADVEGAASVVRYDDGDEPAAWTDPSAADAQPAAAMTAATLFDRLTSGLRSVYTYLVAPSAAAAEAAEPETLLYPDADGRPSVVIASTRPGRFSHDEAADEHAEADTDADADAADAPARHKRNHFLPIFSVCAFVFFLALLAMHRDERRRAQLAGSGLDGAGDDDGTAGPMRRFVRACQRRRAGRREARLQRRARVRASLGAAAGRVGERLHQRMRQWRQACNEKRAAAAAAAGGSSGDGDHEGALLATREASPDAEGRYSMEEDIAQFRAAADVVSQMVSAEEGRCTAVVGGAKASPQPKDDDDNYDDAARPLRPQPPRPPRAAGYMHVDMDEPEVAPPAYSPEDTSQGWTTEVFAGRTGFYSMD